MGVAVAPRPLYESAIKRLFPQGDYWDKQFADPKSDVSLFAKAKLDELIRFRGRMSRLQDESRPETTDELISDWERVLLDALNPDKSLAERRLLLKSKENNKLNRAELQNIADLFGLTIIDITFPYRPAFFGHLRFNRRAGSLAVFSVLRFIITKPGLFQECWEIIKAEHSAKAFGRLRFGIDRLAYFPVYKRREIVLRHLRSSCFGSMRFCTGRLFPDADNNYQNYFSDLLDRMNFQFRFENALAAYIIIDKKLFKEFEQAVKSISLANHIIYFSYTEV